MSMGNFQCPSPGDLVKFNSSFKYFVDVFHTRVYYLEQQNPYYIITLSKNQF